MAIGESFVKNYMPVWFQNVLITLINVRAYKQRRSGNYWHYRVHIASLMDMSSSERELYIINKRTAFLKYATENSERYGICRNSDLDGFPILEKEEIISDIESLITISKKDGIKSSTGGTTGASMTVYYSQDNMQERMAYLDDFRARFGYELGSKVAWFSGKDILGKNMVSGKISRYDFANKIRFYSTFDINRKNFDAYWRSFVDFQPEYFVGFPSSVYEICEMALSKGLKLKCPVIAFFPTAETVLDSHRKVIKEVLGCEIYDQYASSEGAPFIFECVNHKYHIQETTGVFELYGKGEVDSLKGAEEGELLVTSFTTFGVPLIRYRIGDRLKLSEKGAVCGCGDAGRLVYSIDGRESDYLWSKEKGRVNLGNLSNATKGVAGIVCFQATQDSEDLVSLKVVSSDLYTESSQSLFLANVRARLGEVIGINIDLVDHIPREKSGKFRIVKNSINK